jgi:single-strand DNA-binding protein
MSFINHITLLGNLCNDPEVRFTSGGTPVANFRLATNERGSVDDTTGKPRQHTNFHNVVVWGKLAEVCGQYLKKGRRIILDGRIQYRSYEDKEGDTKHVTEIVSRDVRFLDAPPTDSADAE